MSDRESDIAAQPVIHLSSVISVAPIAVAAPNDVDCVVHNLQTGATYRLNDVGARIWELLETGLDPAGIVSTLRAEYRLPDGVAADQIENDVLTVIADLYRYGLLTVQDTDSVRPL
jgi:hypothetical protein